MIRITKSSWRGDAERRKWDGQMKTSQGEETTTNEIGRRQKVTAGHYWKRKDSFQWKTAPNKLSSFKQKSPETRKNRFTKTPQKWSKTNFSRSLSTKTFSLTGRVKSCVSFLSFMSRKKEWRVPSGHAWTFKKEKEALLQRDKRGTSKSPWMMWQGKALSFFERKKQEIGRRTLRNVKR